MQINKMKNIIVLKGMSSNVIEEAIVVLKPNVKLKQSEHINNKKQNVQEKNKRKVIVKEAEDVIKNYVEQIQLKNKIIENQKLKNRYKFLKIMNIILIVVSIFCIINIF